MNLKYKTSTLALSIAGFLAVEAHLTTAQAQIDEIIVTARKREQSLQTVPIAVSAFSGQNLIDAGVGSSSSLGEIVPNLSVFSNNVGFRATLRGQSINEGLITEGPSVNVNVDGVYIARTYAGNIPFVDVSQVEVLRGPQGTLLGRNTTGGAINITTKLPEYEWGGQLGGRIGNAQRGDVWGSINIPIVEDMLAVRGSLQLKNAGGFEDEKSNLGQSPFDEDSKQFFGSLLFEPVDNLDVVLRGDWNTARQHYLETPFLVNIDPVGTGGGSGLYGAVVGADTGGALTPATAFAQFGFPNAQAELPIKTALDTPSHFNSDGAGVSLTVNWESDLINIKGIASKRWITSSNFYDLDGTPIRVLAPQLLIDHSQTTGEIQFYGDFDLLSRNMEWIAGVFYFEEEAFNPSASIGLPAISPLIPNIISGTGENDSIAGFAELDYEIIEDFRITMGGRYTVDTKYASNNNSAGQFSSQAIADMFAGGALTFQIPNEYFDLVEHFDSINVLDHAGLTRVDVWSICRVPVDQLTTPGVCFTENEDTFKAFSWNFGWDWTAWDDGANSALVYANYKRSFRSGGQNFRSTFATNNAFDPEFVRQVAAGAKLDLLDGNLRFNVEGFHQAITGKQVLTVQAAAGGGLGTIVSNAASANVKGIEFEMNWTPLPDTLEGLQLNGSLGWTDPVYNEFPDRQPRDPSLAINNNLLDPAFNPVVTISRANDPFIRVTELSANASIIYNQAIFDSCEGNWMTRLDWSFKSDTPLEESSEDDINKPGFGPLASQSTSDYFLINARSALSMWDNMVELGIWCRNCTDTQYIQNALDLRDSLGYALAEPSIPRTFGADLTYRWGAAN